MDNVKNDAYYVKKILQDANFIVEHTKNVNQKDLEENEILLDSMMFRMVQIAENASRLTSAFKSKHISVDWHSINGMRNRIVHDYGKVDLSIIYETIKQDIPTLSEYLQNVI
ncbi:MAG: DUF86 domain-containing protein [Clostridia bacterium]|nr:DUF86 domain-containing protein [Clostridia bacterium]